MSLAFDYFGTHGTDAMKTTLAVAHMKKLGLPTRIADIAKFPKITPMALIALMANDKKAKGGRLTFILSHGIGEAFVTQAVDMTCVHDALASSMEK